MIEYYRNPESIRTLECSAESLSAQVKIIQWNGMTVWKVTQK